jgi:hypothetical protein
MLTNQPLSDTMNQSISLAVSAQIKAQPVARFKLNDQHDLIVRKIDDGYKFTLTVTCDTCSISETASKAVIFAYRNGIFRMMIDGANFKRI